MNRYMVIVAVFIIAVCIVALRECRIDILRVLAHPRVNYFVNVFFWFVFVFVLVLFCFKSVYSA